MSQSPATAVSDAGAFQEAWRSLIRAHRLEVDPEQPDKAKGAIGDHPFELRWDRDSARVRVAIRRVPLVGMKRRDKNGGVKTGDEAFDARVRIEGDRVVALASLNARARKIFLDALTLDPQLERGVLMCELKASAERIASNFETLTGLAIALSAGHSFLCPRLWHRFRTEPEAGVRLEVLDALLSLRPPSEVKTEAATAALDDSSTPVVERAQAFLKAQGARRSTSPAPAGARQQAVPDPTPEPEPPPEPELEIEPSADPETQLLEALGRGHRGDRAIDRLAMDTRVPIEIRVAAMAARADGTGTTRDELRATLTRRQTGDDRVPMLEATLVALADGSRGTLMAVADGIIGTSPDDVLDYAGMLATLAGVLGSTGDSRAEPRLLKILATPDSRCQRAAVRALGTVGTTGAVSALARLSEETSLTPLRRAARRATDRIEQRYGPADETDPTTTT